MRFAIIILAIVIFITAAFFIVKTIKEELFNSK